TLITWFLLATTWCRATIETTPTSTVTANIAANAPTSLRPKVQLRVIGDGSSFQAPIGFRDRVEQRGQRDDRSHRAVDVHRLALVGAIDADVAVEPGERERNLAVRRCAHHPAAARGALDGEQHPEVVDNDHGTSESGEPAHGRRRARQRRDRLVDVQ